jgi:hypothetical protein
MDTDADISELPQDKLARLMEWRWTKPVLQRRMEGRVPYAQ